MTNPKGHSKRPPSIGGQLRRPTGCTCKPLERATGRFKGTCPTHNPLTTTVGAADVGLSESCLALLLSMDGGQLHPRHASGSDVRLLQAAGYIAAAGDSPEDGWYVTLDGRRLIHQVGTFRVLEPASPWWERLTRRQLAAASLALLALGALVASVFSAVFP